MGYNLASVRDISGMDTGRVDPRVGSGRVTGQIQSKFGWSGRVEISDMWYYSAAHWHTVSV